MTFVYITHSQEEALTMSDRVVLMRRGRIEQSGPPVELFDRPVSRFAAEFMGFENILPGVVIATATRPAGGWPGRRRRADPRSRPTPAARPAPRRWSPCAPSGWRRC